MKYKLTILLFAIATSTLLINNIAKADIFVLNLKYDLNKKFLSFADQNGKVLLDKQKTLSIFELDTNEKKTGDYVAKVFDVKDFELFNTEFQPTSEVLQLEIPYMATASYLKIYIKKNNQEILNASLSQFITCNNNGICEYEKSETALNCIGDCANSNPVFSEQTKKELKNNSGAIKDKDGKTLLVSNPEQNNTETAAESSGKTTLVILIFSVFIFVSAISFLLYKKFFRKDQDV